MDAETRYPPDRPRGERRAAHRRLVVAGLIGFVAVGLAVEPAAAAGGSACELPPSLAQFIDNVFGLVVVGGVLTAAVRATGAWALGTARSDPNDRSEYKGRRNDAAKTGVGLALFGTLGATALELVPASATAGNPAACVQILGAVAVWAPL